MFNTACMHTGVKSTNTSQAHIRRCVEVIAVMMEGTIYRRHVPQQVQPEEMEKSIGKLLICCDCRIINTFNHQGNISSPFCRFRLSEAWACLPLKTLALIREEDFVHPEKNMKYITTTIAALFLLSGCDNGSTPSQLPTQEVGIVTLKSQLVSIVSELTWIVSAM